jgi:hypothetical protein
VGARWYAKRSSRLIRGFRSPRMRFGNSMENERILPAGLNLRWTGRDCWKQVGTREWRIGFGHLIAESTRDCDLMRGSRPVIIRAMNPRSDKTIMPTRWRSTFRALQLRVKPLCDSYGFHARQTDALAARG